MVIIGGLGPGGLDSWDPLMKGIGIVTWGYPDSNPKLPTNPQTTHLQLVESFSFWIFVGELSHWSNFLPSAMVKVVAIFVGDGINSSHL